MVSLSSYTIKHPDGKNLHSLEKAVLSPSVLFFGGNLSLFRWLCISDSPRQGGKDELVEADIFTPGLQRQGFV